LNYNSIMKKLFLLLILSFFSAQGYAGSCPDGSEPERSISADGTYYVFNCGNNTNNTSTSNKDSSAKYTNQTAHFSTIKHQDYDIFPYFEIVCRSVFEAPWVGFKGLKIIKEYLSKPNNQCQDLSYKDPFFSLWDLPEAGVRIDLDNDGIRDLLVFLYGFQPGYPLKMVAFKFDREEFNWFENNKSPIVRVFDAKEIFASGEYPTIQNARFLSVADFNSDEKLDILISDGGYDTEPITVYNSKLLLSSANGFEEKNIGPKRKIHGSASADINGDGSIDVLFGKSRAPNRQWLASQLYMNDGFANFRTENSRLPQELRRNTVYQPQFVELLDVDDDGFIDIISGQTCGKYSKIFWNDGQGFFSDQRFTKIPLDYSETAGVFDKCDRVNYTNIDAVFLVQEPSTKKRYLGTISSIQWKGRKLSLFNIKGRSLLPSLTKKSDPFIEAPGGYEPFAYKISYQENKSGHELTIFDFHFSKISLKFDPHSEKYLIIKKPIFVSEQNKRLKFDHLSIMSGNNAVLTLTSEEEEKVKPTAKPKKIQEEELSPYQQSQIKLLTDQRKLQVCSEVFNEFFGGDYYNRTNKDTYFFVSLDSNGKDCHYEWAGDEISALDKCEQNTKANGKCTIFAIGDTRVWANPQLYKELTGKK